MKKLKHFMLLFFSLMVLASCNSSKPTMTESKVIIKKIKEKLHDTIFKIEKDSSSYQALIECQNSKVVVKEVVRAESGRILKSPKVQLHNNTLQIDCEARAQELLARWKSTHTEGIQYKTITITKYINKLTWWQETQIKGFRLLFLFLLLYIIWQFIKLYYTRNK